MTRDLSHPTRARLLAIATAAAAVFAPAGESPAAHASGSRPSSGHSSSGHASGGHASGGHASGDQASGDQASGDHASHDRVPTPRPAAAGAGATPPADSTGDAAEPDVALPRFRSVLDDYRPYRAEEPLRPWREINDEVGRLGGHAGALGAAPDEAAAGDAPSGGAR